MKKNPLFVLGWDRKTHPLGSPFVIYSVSLVMSKDDPRDIFFLCVYGYPKWRGLLYSTGQIFALHSVVVQILKLVTYSMFSLKFFKIHNGVWK